MAANRMRAGRAAADGVCNRVTRGVEPASATVAAPPREDFRNSRLFFRFVVMTVLATFSLFPFVFSLFLSHRHNGQVDEAGVVGRVIDPLHGLPGISRLGPEDIRHERLWVAIVQREP